MRIRMRGTKLDLAVRHIREATCVWKVANLNRGRSKERRYEWAAPARLAIGNVHSRRRISQNIKEARGKEARIEKASFRAFRSATTRPHARSDAAH